MSIREALDEMRVNRKGTVTSLVLCKRELFYLPRLQDAEETVYPVTPELAEEEARHFGCEWSIQ